MIIAVNITSREVTLTCSICGKTQKVKPALIDGSPVSITAAMVDLFRMKRELCDHILIDFNMVSMELAIYDKA